MSEWFLIAGLWFAMDSEPIDYGYQESTIYYSLPLDEMEYKSLNIYHTFYNEDLLSEDYQTFIELSIYF